MGHECSTFISGDLNYLPPFTKFEAAAAVLVTLLVRLPLCSFDEDPPPTTL